MHIYAVFSGPEVMNADTLYLAEYIQNTIGVSQRSFERFLDRQNWAILWADAIKRVKDEEKLHMMLG